MLAFVSHVGGTLAFSRTGMATVLLLLKFIALGFLTALAQAVAVAQAMAEFVAVAMAMAIMSVD